MHYEEGKEIMKMIMCRLGGGLRRNESALKEPMAFDKELERLLQGVKVVACSCKLFRVSFSFLVIPRGRRTTDFIPLPLSRVLDNVKARRCYY